MDANVRLERAGIRRRNRGDVRKTLERLHIRDGDRLICHRYHCDGVQGDDARRGHDGAQYCIL
jgi:hypothetical protein